MLPNLPTWPNLSIAGIFDILVVSFLVYQGLMVVRGTRAGHILIGILVMVFLWVAAIGIGLPALRAVLSFIVPYLGIAIVVLFQSEIRRTLARIGRKRWLGKGFHEPESIGDILLAVRDLARDNIGAIIVLERDIGLRTFIESGVRLDANISHDLLLAIFQPKGALHDGAVIVQKDKIAAASCFLPLTTAPGLSRQFGTRHRAAIGITEETDCLSVIVSEETGRISVAASGLLTPGLRLSEVEERIYQHFGVERPAHVQIGETPADIPLAEETKAPPPEIRQTEKVNRT
jgi:diadenylate cyclase